MALRRNIGIDLGTANTLIYLEDKGIVVNEPSVLAVDPKERRIVAIGSEARAILGRGGEELIGVNPLEEGVISDFEMTKSMLSHYVGQFYRWKIFKPNIVMCVPSGITDVEARALRRVAQESGGAQVHLIEEPTAAALGEGLDPMEPKGKMLIDMGGGTTELGVLSYGRLVVHHSLRIAGNTLDRSIRRRIKRDHSLAIGIDTAEDLKKNLLSALNMKHGEVMTVTGMDLAEGRPREIEVTGYQIFEYCEKSLRRLMDMIIDSIQTIPPQLLADVVDGGVLLTGGGALIPHLAERIAQETGFEVYRGDKVLTAIAEGAGLAIKREDILSMSRIGKNVGD